MKFNQETLGALYYIQAHAEGEVKVLVPPEGELINPEPTLRVFNRSFIISPHRLLTDWAPQNLEELEPDHLALTLEMNPELVILGTGSRLQFPHPTLFSTLMENGIGYEVMDTGAACRTYNVLAAEGRQVVTAIFVSKETSG